MASGTTVAEQVVAALADAGTRRLFGVPGGGSSLDLIAAADAVGIDFVLTAGETAAAIMAAVTAELTGTPGAALTAMGPGALSALNGVAYAWLERAPIVLISDCLDGGQVGFVSHQVVDHAGVFAPVVKASVRLEAAGAGTEIARLVAIALTPPAGPVHVDLSGAAARSVSTGGRLPSTPTTDDAALDEASVAAVRERLAGCASPVLLVGMEARDAAAAAAVRAWADEFACPVLSTYKAKGVIADDAPNLIGHVTGAAAERACLEAADLIVLCGLDPVELIPRLWDYGAPAVELAQVPRERRYVEPAATVVGPLASAIRAVRGANRGSAWTPAAMRALKEGMAARLASPPVAGPAIAPQRLVEAVQAAAPDGIRATVDAGAHMIPAMAFWSAGAAGDVLISNALSTMGFALPAAIAAALATPDRPVVALTGDGGLLMCLGELATAARLGVDVTAVVFNDAAMSLIDVKQRQRAMASTAMRYPRADLAMVARGLGWRAWRVEDEAALAPALNAAFAGPGPALLDVAVDPGGYRAQLEALRG